MYEKDCGFIIYSSEQFWNIVTDDYASSQDRNKYYEVEKNIERYINEKGTSSEKIYKLINEYA